MRAGEPSQTAMMAAVVRGMHRLEAAEPWVFDDPLALKLVGPGWKAVRDRLADVLTEPLMRSAGTMVVGRARYAEERLAGGAFEQYAILGAGLDSFAWRRPELLDAGLTVFELDHPDSQAWKVARAEEVGLTNHDRHVFVPVDFELETVAAALDRAGFDWSRRTFFTWLGVLPYLTVDAAEATLCSLAGSAPGSQIVLSYVIAPPLMEDVGREFHTRFTGLSETVGEPLQSELTPDEAEALVRRCGLEVADHPGTAEMETRYYAGRTDGLVPITFEQLLTARVPGA